MAPTLGWPLTCFCSSTRAQSILDPTSGGSTILSYRARYSAHSWATRSCSCLMLPNRWPAGQGWAWGAQDPSTSALEPSCHPTHSFSISSACGCLSRWALSTSRKRSFSSTSASFRLRPVSCWCCRAWLCSLRSRSCGHGRHPCWPHCHPHPTLRDSGCPPTAVSTLQRAGPGHLRGRCKDRGGLGIPGAPLAPQVGNSAEKEYRALSPTVLGDGQ